MTTPTDDELMASWEPCKITDLCETSADNVMEDKNLWSEKTTQTRKSIKRQLPTSKRTIEKEQAQVILVTAES